MKEKITIQRLKDVLEYDPDSGEFRWLAGRQNWIGKVAGTIGPQGYRHISIDGVQYRAHRLAFFYMTGAIPTCFVDHVDCNRLNNRWVNLRPADNSENNANRGPFRNNTSGFKGVSWEPRRRKWRAVIKVRGRTVRIGRFDTAEEAGAAYRLAASENFGEFARTTRPVSNRVPEASPEAKSNERAGA